MGFRIGVGFGVRIRIRGKVRVRVRVRIQVGIGVRLGPGLACRLSAPAILSRRATPASFLFSMEASIFGRLNGRFTAAS